MAGLSPPYALPYNFAFQAALVMRVEANSAERLAEIKALIEAHLEAAKRSL